MLAPERKAGTQFAQLHASGHIMFKSELRNKEKGRKTWPNKQSNVPHLNTEMHTQCGKRT